MNPVVAGLTARTLLGRRRALLFLLLPLLLFAVATLVRWRGSPQGAVDLMTGLAASTLIPLLGVIIGTGVIGPEIDDGAIAYLLAKPIRRQSIVVSKLAVAVAALGTFGALPLLLAGLLLPGFGIRLALGFALGSLAAGTAYCAAFLMLAVLTRHAVSIGLVYTLVWESLVGNYVPGARALSIQQWGSAVSLAVGQGSGWTPAVSTTAGVIGLVVVTLACTVVSGRRLRTLRLSGDE
jgi:ABC-2 type transport system permease protein